MGWIWEKMKRPWGLVMICVAGCWAVLFLGPLSLLMIVLLIAGVAIGIAKRMWIALAMLVVLNPLSVNFVMGVRDYLGGSPIIGFRGLPTLESFNLKSEERCYHRSWGCMVCQNEWATVEMRNTGVRLMCRIYGPPKNTYHGPYPTEEEALEAVKDAEATDWKGFVQGKVKADKETVNIGKATVERMLESLEIFVTDAQDERVLEEVGLRVNCTAYRNECLVVRLREENPLDEREPVDKPDVLMLVDKKRMEVFALYRIHGRFPNHAFGLMGPARD